MVTMVEDQLDEMKQSWSSQSMEAAMEPQFEIQMMFKYILDRAA